MDQELDIRELMRWQRAGRHEEVVREASARLVNRPEDRDLLIAAAVSLRCLGQAEKALELHKRLDRLRARFSLIGQERALCHLLRDAVPEAIDALERAVKINPLLP